LFVLFVTFDLIQAICLGGLWYVSDARARNAMSAKLNIEPSWQSLVDYNEAHFKVGMTRDDVLEQAEKVGSVNINFFFIGEMYCEIFSFDLGPFNSARGGRWGICYDRSGNATQIEQMLRR
jgi:hypothetical protein